MARDGTPSGGRPKGRVNDRTLAVQRFCRSVCEDPEYRASVLQRARTNTLGSMEPVIWAYGYGKPKETVDLHVQVEEESLSLLSTEELALCAEALVRRLHEAQDAERELAPYIEVLTPKSLMPACPDDTIDVTPLRKDEESAGAQASTETRESDHEASRINTGDVSVDAKSACMNSSPVSVNADRDGENGGLLSMLRKLGGKQHAT